MRYLFWELIDTVLDSIPVAWWAMAYSVCHGVSDWLKFRWFLARDWQRHVQYYSRGA